MIKISKEITDKNSMKFLAIFVVLVTVAAGVAFWGYQRSLELPIETYNKIVKDSSYNDYFKLKRRSNVLLWSQDIEGEDAEFAISKSSRLWKQMYLKNFAIPFPIKHPLYKLIPIIKYSTKQKRPLLGYKLMNQSNKLVLSVEEIPHAKFLRNLNSQEIFRVPVFQDYLRKLPNSVVWKDLFMRDLREVDPSNYLQMVYNLYVLYLRSIYIPRNFVYFDYVEDFDRAVISIFESDVNYTKERVVFPVHGVIYGFEIRTFSSDAEAMAMRSKLMKEIKFEHVSEEFSRIIYKEFKFLPFEVQTSEVGMAYLFTAWSQELESRRFLKEMIQFLERGKDNFVQLQPLYDYALFKFDTSFSKRDEQLEETAAERLKRKEQEELEEEVRNAKMTDLQAEGLEFPDDDAKVEYLLRRANENTTQDSDDDVLIVD